MDTHNIEPTQPVRIRLPLDLEAELYLQALFVLTFGAFFLIGTVSAGARPTTGTPQSPVITPTPVTSRRLLHESTAVPGSLCLWEYNCGSVPQLQTTAALGPGERNKHY